MDADFQRIRTSRINRMNHIDTGHLSLSRLGHTSHPNHISNPSTGHPSTGHSSHASHVTDREPTTIANGFAADAPAGSEADIEAVNRRRAIRSTLIVSALGAVAVTAALLSPSAASGAAPASATMRSAAADLPAPVSGSPSSAFTRIADFYGAYIDAVSTDGSGGLGDQLRAFYLTKELRQTLATWEAANHADGVLRAQNTPLSWSVASDGSGAGHTWAIVTLTWSAGHTTRLHIQADLATKRISDIKPLAAD
jgi:hypothetical protein